MNKNNQPLSPYEVQTALLALCNQSDYLSTVTQAVAATASLKKAFDLHHQAVEELIALIVEKAEVPADKLAEYRKYASGTMQDFAKVVKEARRRHKDHLLKMGLKADPEAMRLYALEVYALSYMEV